MRQTAGLSGNDENDGDKRDNFHILISQTKPRARACFCKKKTTVPMRRALVNARARRHAAFRAALRRDSVTVAFMPDGCSDFRSASGLDESDDCDCDDCDEGFHTR